MPRRFLLLTLCVAVAALCARLGFWQLDRLAERRAFNARAAARLAGAPVDVAALGDTGDLIRFRRVRARGEFDYSNEIALTSRSFNGAPGVYLFTPLRRDGTDTLVLVLRGWVYSPDAATIDFVPWREAAPVTLEGYALPFPEGETSSDSSGLAPRAVRRLDRDRLAARLGEPVAGYYVVMTSGAAPDQRIPVRLDDPALTDGPHLSYAVQWFLFGTIFGVGGSVILLRRRLPRSQVNSS